MQSLYVVSNRAFLEQFFNVRVGLLFLLLFPQTAVHRPTACPSPCCLLGALVVVAVFLCVLAVGTCRFIKRCDIWKLRYQWPHKLEKS